MTYPSKQSAQSKQSSASENPAYIEQALFHASSIKLIEQNSVKNNDQELYDLMELAGAEIWKCIETHWPVVEPICIICGKGNNAGDGFVMARLAAQKGKRVQVLMVTNSNYQGDALKAYEAMCKEGVIPKPFDAALLENHPLIVDAILGTGLKGPLRDNFKLAIESINDYRAKSKNDTDSSVVDVLSIDIPSGLESDTGFANPIAINADRTISFIALKSGMVTGDARAFCGQIEVTNLQVKIDDNTSAEAWIDDADALIKSLPKRLSTSHKGDHGHLLLIGGDYGFGGAILMSAMAAARSGAGKLTILTRDAHVAPILTQCPEAMIRSVTGAGDASLQKLLEDIDAVVIGPGLGQGEWGGGLLSVICATKLPLLIDADALNILAKQNTETSIDTNGLLNKEINKEPNKWVMTPHPGEAARLLNVEITEIQQNRYQAARDIQQKYSAVVVLKGAGTITESYQGQTTVCTEGNAGMASAGMGDILSGIIGTLLSQGVEASLAARIGVALHARAGDLAAMNGEKGLMATDLISPLRMLVNQ